MPHFSSSMGNRRKRKRSKKRSSKPKAHPGSEDVLSAELREKLPAENGSNMLVLSTDHKKQRPKKKKREEDPPKMSRKKAKLQRIKRRKERERLLADMYTSLRQKKLGAVERELMLNTHRVGQRETSKQRFKRLRLRQQAGLSLDESEASRLAQMDRAKEEAAHEDDDKDFDDTADSAFCSGMGTLLVPENHFAVPSTIESTAESSEIVFNPETDAASAASHDLINKDESTPSSKNSDGDLNTDTATIATGKIDFFNTTKSGVEAHVDVADATKNASKDDTEGSESAGDEVKVRTETGETDFSSPAKGVVVASSKNDSEGNTEAEAAEVDTISPSPPADVSAPRAKGELPLAASYAIFPPGHGKGGVVASGPQPKSNACYVLVHRNPTLQQARLKLPVCGMEREIMEAIAKNDVVILCGPTGSGKTTQLPQFLYEAGYGNHPEKPGLIGVTQPRRVAAMSVAERVATELRGSKVVKGSDASLADEDKGDKKKKSGSLVGHQVRYNKRGIGARTKIKFMTEGILLREVESDLLLHNYCALVLDEAHERTVDTDILLGIISRVVPLRRKMHEEQVEALAKFKSQLDKKSKKSKGRKGKKPPEVTIFPLKVVIMSATLRVKDFTGSSLFRSATSPPPVVKVEGRQYPITTHFSRRTPSDEDYLDATVRQTCKVHTRLPPGGILVFLPGQKEISYVCKRLRETYGSKAVKEYNREQKRRARASAQRRSLLNAEAKGDEGDDANSQKNSVDATNNDSCETNEGGEGQKEENAEGIDDSEDIEGEDKDLADRLRQPMEVLPLYSMLPRKAQLRVWKPVSDGSRLVVVATNVAESSLTIPGIRYVVDAGRERKRLFHPASGISHYQVDWISKASAKQRAGRAGRLEGTGHAYRLYSSAVFDQQFAPFREVPMLHHPLEDIVLRLKRLGIDKVSRFPFPTPPAATSLTTAIRNLQRLGSLAKTPLSTIVEETDAAAAEPEGEDESLANVEEEGVLTSMGRAASNYPVAARYGKMIAVANSMGDQSLLVYGLALVACLCVRTPFLDLVGPDQTEPRNDIDAAAAAAVTDDPSGEKARKQAENDLRKHQSEMHAKFADPDSDALSSLNAFGAYSYTAQKLAPPAPKGKDNITPLTLRRVRRQLQEWNADHHLRMQSLKEMGQLRHQLARIVGNQQTDDTVEGDAKAVATIQSLSSSLLKPPSAAERHLLRQLLCSCFIDQVARFEGQINGRPSYRSCNSAVSTTLCSHRGSTVSRLQSGSSSAPMYVCYQELTDGGSHTYMKGLTIVEEKWLYRLARGTVLCRDNIRLDNPAPVYDSESDRVRCFCIPTFGDFSWALPMEKIDFPDDTPRHKQHHVRWFARLLLEGKVLPGTSVLTEGKGLLNFAPKMLTSDSGKDAVQLPQVRELLHALSRKHVTRRAKLVRIWKQRRLHHTREKRKRRRDHRTEDYLLPQLLACVSAKHRAQVQTLWTSIVDKAVTNKTREVKSDNSKFHVGKPR